MRALIIFATLISLTICRSVIPVREPKCEFHHDLDTLWPDSESEEHYYQCIDIGKSIRLKCPDEKLFDYVQQKCVNPDDRTPTTTPVTTTTSTECDTSPWTTTSTTAVPS